MTNNDILKKLRVALQLRNDQIQEIIGLGGLEISLTELGAFFRTEDHRNYRPCGDQVLRNFLDGLIISMRGSRGEGAPAVEAASAAQGDSSPTAKQPVPIRTEREGRSHPDTQKDVRTSAPAYSSKDTQRDMPRDNRPETPLRTPPRDSRPDPRRPQAREFQREPQREFHRETQRPGRSEPRSEPRREPRREFVPDPPRNARRARNDEPAPSPRDDQDNDSQ